MDFGIEAYGARYQVDLLAESGVFSDLSLDLSNRVDHGGVIASAESFSDLGKGKSRVPPRQEHRNLTGHHDLLGASRTFEILNLDVEELRDSALDGFQGCFRLVDLEVALETASRRLQSDGSSVEVAHGQEPGERALELVHIGARVTGYEERHILGKFDAFFVGFLP